MPYLILLLLAPFLDIVLLLFWLFSSPPAALLYWAAATAAGALLVKFAKIGMGEALSVLRRRGAVVAAGGFAAAGLAGMLLIFPGYLTDILAVFILLAAFFGGRPLEPEAPETRPLEVEAEIVDPDERKD